MALCARFRCPLDAPTGRNGQCLCPSAPSCGKTISLTETRKMEHRSRYFELNLDSLRIIGGWAADCAERALPVFLAHADSDPRPFAAIEGIRVFASGGRRTAMLRTLSLAAHAAAREVGHPAAAAAARAAGSAAASAYTHPLRDVEQTKHIIGAAAYAAFALELDQGGDPAVAEAEVRRAIKCAPPAARMVLLHMEPRLAGKNRFDIILYQLDAGIRACAPPEIY